MVVQCIDRHEVWHLKSTFVMFNVIGKTRTHHNTDLHCSTKEILSKQDTCFLKESVSVIILDIL